MPLARRPFEPGHATHLITVDTTAFDEHASEVVLGMHVVLSSGLQVPVRRLRLIPHHAQPELICQREVVLTTCMATLGGQAVPVQGKVEVSWCSDPGTKCIPELHHPCRALHGVAHWNRPAIGADPLDIR